MGGDGYNTHPLPNVSFYFYSSSNLKPRHTYTGGTSVTEVSTMKTRGCPHSPSKTSAYVRFRGWLPFGTTPTFGNERVCSFSHTRSFPRVGGCSLPPPTSPSKTRICSVSGVVALCYHHHPPTQLTTPRSLEHETEVRLSIPPFSFQWRQHEAGPTPFPSQQ